MSPKKIRKLAVGDKIGIVAPGSPMAPDAFQAGVDALSEMGYEVVVPSDPSEQWGKSDHLFSSDSVEGRLTAIHDLIQDPKVGAIITARGGYGSMELLGSLDYSLLSEHPKAILGYSDVTVLNLAVYAAAGIVTVHGPALVSSLSKATEVEDAKQSSEILVDFLSGDNINPYSETKLENIIREGECEGLLVGGNIAMAACLVGTPWDPDYTDHILVIEEIGEKPYRVHRDLQQMKLAGKLENLSGVVLGYFTNCVHPQGLGPTVQDVLEDIFKDYDYPVVGHVAVGHESPHYPLPLGVKGRIAGDSFEILESAVA